MIHSPLGDFRSVFDGGFARFGRRSAVRNLLTFTEELDNAAWAKNRLSVSANAGNDPNGATTADKIIPNATSSAYHYIGRSSLGLASASVISIHAKADGYDFFEITANNGAAAAPDRAIFDLSGGSVSESAGDVTGQIVDLGGGWYRCVALMSAALSAFYMHSRPDGNTTSFTGDGSSGALAWGAQLELAGAVTGYQKV